MCTFHFTITVMYDQYLHFDTDLKFGGVMYLLSAFV